MAKKTSKDFGRHYLVEFSDCDPRVMKKVKDVRSILLRAARESKATVLKHYFYQFKPFGVTAIIMIAESHFALHTWPEERFAAFDLLTCGRMYPRRAINHIQKAFKAKKVKIRIFKRGPDVSLL